MQNDWDHQVELIGDNGETVQFEHLMTLAYEGHSYVLLTPAKPETPDEEGAVVILRIEEGGEEDTYVVVEDDAVLEAVFDRYLELSEEADEDDDDTDA